MEGGDQVKKDKNPLNCLKLEIHKIMGEHWREEMSKEIPRSFVRHGDLILIDGSCFSSPFWKGFGGFCMFSLTLGPFAFNSSTIYSWTESSIWEVMSSVLQCNRIAKKGSVLRDGFRTPCVSLLRGVDPWVVHKDNGIMWVQ